MALGMPSPANPGALNRQADQTRFAVVVDKSESLSVAAYEIEVRLATLATRVFGPRATLQQNAQPDTAAQGHFGALEQRLSGAGECLDRIGKILAELEGAF